MLCEGVSSAWFEVVAKHPSVTPPAHSKGRVHAIWFSGQAFDPATWKMYAGYENKECGILCQVTFSFSVVKQRKEGEARREQ